MSNLESSSREATLDITESMGNRTSAYVSVLIPTSTGLVIKKFVQRASEKRVCRINLGFKCRIPAREARRKKRRRIESANRR